MWPCALSGNFRPLDRALLSLPRLPEKLGFCLRDERSF